jgi:hypothetical protein
MFSPMFAADTEQGFYFAELAGLVFSAAPMALILIGLTFLRRKEATRILFGMQVTAGIWLALAVANRLLAAWHRGLFNADKDSSLDRLRVYVSIVNVTGNLQVFAFIFFGILFLVYCRQRVTQEDLI